MNNIYIAMLRGINVSGQKKIKMADLKLLFESVGLTDVVTYIQSGNVIFTSANSEVDVIKGNLEKAIEKKYKFKVPILIRTKSEMSKVIKQNPFVKVQDELDGAKLLVTFLTHSIPKSKITEIRPFAADSEDFKCMGKEIYLSCPNGYGRSKLTNSFLERKLENTATTRNWKTVKKLFELSQS